MTNYRFERIRREVDGVQYVSKYIRMKKVGLIYKAVCPFHNEKTPSLTIYPADYMKDGKRQGYMSFYCFGCGAGGDLIEFKKLKEGFNTREEACEEIEKEFGFVSDDDIALHSFMEEELTRIQNSFGNMLSLTEINLICSSICRNYLKWIKEYFPKYWESEIKVIEKFYKHFDCVLLEQTALEAMSLIEEVQKKIDDRRQKIKNGEN